MSNVLKTRKQQSIHIYTHMKMHIKTLDQGRRLQ